MRASSLLIATAVVAGFAMQAPCFGQASPPTPPATEVFTKFKPNDIATILRDAGYRAEVVTENQRTRIRTGMGGYNVYVYLFSCDDDGACASLQYSLGLTKSPIYTLSVANKWNQDKRFAKAYLDTNGNMFLEADVYFRGGVGREVLSATARIFDDSVADFRTMINGLSSTK
jgi:hypothetical protein